MRRDELSRIWRLISDASPKGVWLELSMLEQWAQEATERHGGVPVHHLVRSLPWAARRLNWKARAEAAQPGQAPRWPEAREAEAVASAAMAELLGPRPAPEAPAPPARRGQGTPLAEALRPKAPAEPQRLAHDAMPAPRRNPSLADRQREARRRGELDEAHAMADVGLPGRAPSLWADEAGELLPEWAQVLGLHEHPVQTAREGAAVRDQALWTTAYGREGAGLGERTPALPHPQPNGRTPAQPHPHPTGRAPAQPHPYPTGQAEGPTVAELLAQGPESWPEPEAELPWPWGGDRPPAHEGPRFESRGWPKSWGLGAKGLGAALAKLPPEYAAAGAMLGLATAVMVVWA